MIDDRHVNVLRAIARYYVLTRAQIQRLCFPADSSGRVSRRHVAELHREGMLERTRVQVVLPGGPTAPAYFPAQKGLQLLFEYEPDPAVLGVSCRAPNPYHLAHWLAISETHIALDAALALQPDVRCEAWLNEWDVANPEAKTPEEMFRLYTLLESRPRLVCAPDAAFLLDVDGDAKVFYLEQDRNTSGVFQVASSKTPGYAALAEKRLHRLRHFPRATVERFAVLMVAPTGRRRDALRAAVKGKPGADLWRFAAVPDLTPQAFLSGPVWHPCDGDPRPLVKQAVAS